MIQRFTVNTHFPKLEGGIEGEREIKFIIDKMKEYIRLYQITLIRIMSK